MKNISTWQNLLFDLTSSFWDRFKELVADSNCGTALALTRPETIKSVGEK
jgi:hypothetical protein